MPTANLTDRTIRALKAPSEGQVDYFDKSDRGLHMRVSSGGTKTFMLKYVVDGRQRKARLGRYPDLPLANAREKASNWRRMAADGIDPAVERDLAREERQRARANSFEAVVEDFIEKYAKPRQRTWAETRRTLLTGCAEWKARPFASITKRDAHALLDGFVAAGRHHKAARTLSWLKTLWRWAAKREIVDMAIMDAVSIEIEKAPRDRTYTDDEIEALWRAADRRLDQRPALPVGTRSDRRSDGSDTALPPLVGAYVKLIILLGVRRAELAGMRWSELDDPEAPTFWTIPFERTKSRKRSAPRVYPTPLPPLAQRILRDLARRRAEEDVAEEDRDIVFLSRKRGVPMDAGTPMKAKVRAASGVADWSPHAHRHTIATWLENAGHSEYERGLVLNHSGSGVTAGYSHGYPVDLKRRLLTEWAAHVESVVAAEGVAVLR